MSSIRLVGTPMERTERRHVEAQQLPQVLVEKCIEIVVEIMKVWKNEVRNKRKE